MGWATLVLEEAVGRRGVLWDSRLLYACELSGRKCGTDGGDDGDEEDSSPGYERYVAGLCL